MPYARYSGYGTDPAQYAMGQQERQDEQFRNLINMMIALSKYKTEQGQYSQEWQNKLSEQTAARSIEERRTKAYEESVRGRTGDIPDWLQKAMIISQKTGKQLGQVVEEMEFPPKKTVAQIKADAKASAEGGREGAPLQPQRPSAYAERKKGILDAIKAGTITPTQGYQSLWNIPKETIPPRGQLINWLVTEGLAKDKKEAFKMTEPKSTSIIGGLDFSALGIPELNATPSPSPTEEVVIINPKTKERKALRNGQWVTIK